MKNVILIFILIITTSSLAKNEKLIFSRTFNLRYPYYLVKEKKSLSHNPYEIYFPHLGDSICRIDSFKICVDTNLNKEGKIKAWEKYKKLCSKDGSYQLILADEYANYGDYNAAQGILEEAIKDAKFDTRYHKLLLHVIYINLRKINESIDLALSLIKDYPDFDGGYKRLAVNGMIVKDWVKSRSLLEEALLLNNKNDITYILLTTVSYELGEYDKVHLYYEKAFLLNPLVTLMDRSSSLSMLDVHIIEKDFNEANAMITQLLDIDESIKDDPKFIELQKKFENTFNKLSPK